VTQPEDVAAVLQAAQQGFVGTTWTELAAMEAALPPDLALRLAGAFASLARLREQHHEDAARARQLHGGRPGMEALLDRVDGFDVYGAQAAVSALLAGPEALQVLAEQWAKDDPELAAWALAAATLVRRDGRAR
jgi:hypothetical protein